MTEEELRKVLREELGEVKSYIDAKIDVLTTGQKSIESKIDLANLNIESSRKVLNNVSNRLASLESQIETNDKIQEEIGITRKRST